MKGEPKKPGRPSTPQDRKRRKENFTLSPLALALVELEAESTGDSKSGVVEQCIRRGLEKKHAGAILLKAATESLPLVIATEQVKARGSGPVPLYPPESILAFPEIPLLHAAAGSPAASDTGTYAPTRDLGPGRFAVQLHGESMSPRFPDGSIVILRERDSLKKPVLKKGEIYLFNIGGDKTLKAYSSRPATEREIAIGIAYTSPRDGKQKVRILKSLNHEYPEIRVSEDVAWIGWLDKADNR